jgi:hypothetical protein
MKIFGSRLLMVAGLAGAAGLMLNVNCGGSDGGGGTGGSGTGGTHTGGTTGTGGTHTGGTTGTGGTGTGGTHTGGTTGTGGTAGASPTGGTAGSSATGGVGGSSATGGVGGSSATGGVGGGAGSSTNGGAGGHATGGSGGAAGASATGGTAGGSAGNGGVGGAIVGTALATFDPTDAGSTAALDQFAFNIYNGSPGNLAIATDAQAAATLSWSASEGNPSPGALSVDAPFHAYNQYVDVQRAYPTTNLQNWTGKTTLHVRVKIASGLNPSASYPPGIQPYVTSYTAPATDGGTAAYNFCGTYTNAVAGNGWADYTVSLVASSSHCANLDLTKIVNFGVLVQSGGGATGDAGQPAAPTPAVVYLDSFSAS